MTAALQQAEARRAQVESEARLADGRLAEERARLRRELDIYERRITELRKTFMRLETLFDEDYGASFLSGRRRDVSAKDRETLALLRQSVKTYQELLESNSVVKNGLIEQLEKDLEAGPATPAAPSSSRALRQRAPGLAEGTGSLPSTPARDVGGKTLRRSMSFSERGSGAGGEGGLLASVAQGAIESVRSFIQEKVF
eukprot:tig00001537_g9299.t1